jgi:hypothetical protein
VLAVGIVVVGGGVMTVVDSVLYVVVTMEAIDVHRCPVGTWLWLWVRLWLWWLWLLLFVIVTTGTRP